MLWTLKSRTFRYFLVVVAGLWVGNVVARDVHAGLIAAYSHENPANRLQDDTGNGHTLANVGGVTFIGAPAQPGFYYFELGDTVANFARGSNQYLAAPDSVYPTTGGSGGDFTFTSLVSKDDTSSLFSGHQTILASDRFRLQWMITRDFGNQTYDVDSQRLHLGTRNTATGTNGPSTQTPNGSFMAGEWYFLALRYDQAANSLQAFVQGASDTWAPVASGVVTPTFPINDFTSFRLGLDGVSGIGSNDDFGGMIDSARFYTTALSNAELEAVFFQFSVPEPSTVMLLLVGLCGLLLRRTRRRA